MLVHATHHASYTRLGERGRLPYERVSDICNPVHYIDRTLAWWFSGLSHRIGVDSYLAPFRRNRSDHPFCERTIRRLATSDADYVYPKFQEMRSSSLQLRREGRKVLWRAMRSIGENTGHRLPLRASSL
jgi:hypothetical protein